jgi:hypothetical protein
MRGQTELAPLRLYAPNHPSDGPLIRIAPTTKRSTQFFHTHYVTSNLAPPRKVRNPDRGRNGRVMPSPRALSPLFTDFGS